MHFKLLISFLFLFTKFEVNKIMNFLCEIFQEMSLSSKLDEKLSHSFLRRGPIMFYLSFH